jgi:hypothetical protein
MTRQRAIAGLTVVMLILALIIQSYAVLEGHVLPIVRRIWEVRHEDALRRSALLAFGDDFANYVAWLRDSIPPNARVAIPKEEQGGLFGNLGLMQYFLFPREIVDCPVEEVEACVTRMTSPRSFILAPNDVFPPRSVLGVQRQFYSYDDIRGVFGPPAPVE